MGVRVPPLALKICTSNKKSIMKVNVEAVSAVEKKLAIEVPWDRVKEELEAAYRGLSKRAKLKGFRAGKFLARF